MQSEFLNCVNFQASDLLQIPSVAEKYIKKKITHKQINECNSLCLLSFYNYATLHRSKLLCKLSSPNLQDSLDRFSPVTDRLKAWTKHWHNTWSTPVETVFSTQFADPSSQGSILNTSSRTGTCDSKNKGKQKFLCTAIQDLRQEAPSNIRQLCL